MTEQKDNVAIYARVSRVGDRAETLTSPDVQIRVGTKHAKDRGLRVDEKVVELDQSGAKMDRPELERLIQRIEAGEIDGIIVHRIDRFARSLVGGIEALERITRAGGFVQTADGQIDTRGANGHGAMAELQRNMLLCIAEWVKSLAAEHFEEAKRGAIAAGIHVCGRVPFGYRRAKDRRLEPDDERADAVREAFRLRATGASQGEVAKMLNERVPGGPSGRTAWSAATVGKLVTNRVYLGEARQGQHVNPSAHPPITDEATFDICAALARAAAEQASELRSTHPGTRSMLAGVARCGSCGYAMVKTRSNLRYEVYQCHNLRNCPAPASAMVPALNELVEREVLDRLTTEAKKIKRIRADHGIDDLTAEIAIARGKRAPFEDPDYVAVIGVAAAKRACAKVDQEIARLESQLAAKIAATHSEGPSAQNVIEIWDTLDVLEKRAVIGREIDAVIVSRPPSRTGPRMPLVERVEIKGRGDGPAFARPPKHGPKVKARVAAA